MKTESIPDKDWREDETIAQAIERARREGYQKGWHAGHKSGYDLKAYEVREAVIGA